MRAFHSYDDLDPEVRMVEVCLRDLTDDVREEGQPVEALDALDTGHLDPGVRLIDILAALQYLT